MAQRNKLKIINDPIYGFVSIPGELMFDIIEHPYFQRLRRITQMGLSYLVYPGAHHTRFHHAIGAMHLMQQAVKVLRSKGVSISEDEEQGLYGAILLHDMGHGPFSHALERSIVGQVSHEKISLLFMEKLNRVFDGRLSVTLQIFKGEYPRAFMNQLVSSQLDMDRSDYLKRDSFYTGVAEGNINSERIISMLNVKDDSLIVEEKGIYSIEQFLIARRLMYWQVYLHKTGLVAEQLLIRVLQRAKELYKTGVELSVCGALEYFLTHDIKESDFNDDILDRFASLDDSDVFFALKQWQHHPDAVISRLSKMILQRDLPKISVTKSPCTEEKYLRHIEQAKRSLGLDEDVIKTYFVFRGKISNTAYHPNKQKIMVLTKTGKLSDVLQVSDQLNLEALSHPVLKHYVCYPKD